MKFENFIVKPSNETAFSAAQAVAENCAEMYNPLCIYGKTGTGKTHLVHAIAQIVGKDPEAKVRIMDCHEVLERFLEQLRTDFSECTLNFFNEFAGLDLLVIEDVQILRGRESTQELFGEFMEYLTCKSEKKTQVVFTSGGSKWKAAELTGYVKTHCPYFLECTIGKPEYELKAEFVKQRAQICGLPISEAGVDAVAKVTTNLAGIIGVMKQYEGRCEIEKSPPGEEILIKILKERV